MAFSCIFGFSSDFEGEKPPQSEIPCYYNVNDPENYLTAQEKSLEENEENEENVKVDNSETEMWAAVEGMTQDM